ncbi:MAG: transcription antitermination factor NusB [Clostridia bacterium]|jgi:N utilization substance protein B
MGRRASRDIAMKLLYQLEIQKEDKEEQIDITLAQNELSKNDRKYVLDVVKGVFENLSYIDKVIDKYSKGWKINRISKVDLSILRLSIYEIGFMNDIPFSVSINEAVELAKKYSNEDAGSFVNGILGKVSKARILPSESSDEEV